MPKKFAASEGRRAPLNMKTTADLRSRLEQAAAASGRALTHEVEHRIEQSFFEDELREYRELKDGDEMTRQLGDSIKLSLGMLNRSSGANWSDNYVAREAVKKAVATSLDFWFSRFPLAEPTKDQKDKAAKASITASFLAKTSVGLISRDPDFANFFSMWEQLHSDPELMAGVIKLMDERSQST